MRRGVGFRASGKTKHATRVSQMQESREECFFNGSDSDVHGRLQYLEIYRPMTLSCRRALFVYLVVGHAGQGVLKASRRPEHVFSRSQGGGQRFECGEIIGGRR